ncbi:Uncharacterised protein [Xylophilus ampelinus]|nr:hypothetical protein [Variovorax sp.]VTY31475.1 Uncharacterised protein [Xylophilus ampelinus]|tara:strand:- start:554 stop:694 length:141 start_codon:yes stop_codon:yes gene_type:complete
MTNRYRTLYRQSVEQPEAFWAEQARLRKAEIGRASTSPAVVDEFLA